MQGLITHRCRNFKSHVYIDHKINMLDTVSFMRIVSIEVTMFMEQEVKRLSCHCRIRNTTVNMHRLCHRRRNLRNTSCTGGELLEIANGITSQSKQTNANAENSCKWSNSWFVSHKTKTKTEGSF